MARPSLLEQTMRATDAASANVGGEGAGPRCRAIARGRRQWRRSLARSLAPRRLIMAAYFAAHPDHAFLFAFGCFACCILEFGGLDHLISNAGIFSSSSLLENIDDLKWEKDIKINLTSHHKVLRESIPYLKLGINPTIVFVGSRNVGAPGPGAGTYTVSKSGLSQMARLAAIELSKHKIRVNIVHPDSVYDTNVWTDKVLIERANNYSISVEEYKKRNLLKTSVGSKDVAELVSFLSSKKSNKTTGAQIPIDGGNERII